MAKRTWEDALPRGAFVEELCHGVKRLHTETQAPEGGFGGQFRQPFSTLPVDGSIRLPGQRPPEPQEGRHNAVEEPQWTLADASAFGSGPLDAPLLDGSGSQGAISHCEYEDANRLLRDLHFARLRRQSIAPGVQQGR